MSVTMSCAAAIRFFPRRTAARWVSALKGISTDVETFGKQVRPSISFRMFSSERCERAKIRLVSHWPSRMSEQGCSVSRECYELDAS